MDFRARWTQYAVKMRWLALLVIASWGLVGPRGSSGVDPGPLGLVIVLGLLYNAVTWLLIRRGFKFALALPGILVDLLIIAEAVQSSGGAHSPLFVLYLSPLVYAAMSYRLLGFVSTVALTALVHVVTASPALFLGGPERALLGFHCLFFAFAGLWLLRVAGDRVMGDDAVRDLSRLARTYAARTDRPSAVPGVLKQVAQGTGAAWLAVYEYDEQQAAFRPWAPAGRAPAELPAGIRALAEEVLTTGELRAVPWDAESEDDAAPLQMIACAPMGSPNSSHTAVLIAATANRLRLFAPQDLALLELVAGELSLLLRETRLGDRLCAQTQLVDTLLRRLDCGVLVADAGQRIVSANHAAASLLQTTADELVGKRVGNVPLPEEIAAVLQGAIDDAEPRAAETHVGEDESETTALRVTAAPVLSEDGVPLGYVTVLTNVTAIAELEKAISLFLSRVTHELRTPLTSIKAYTATLLRDVDFDSETRQDFLGIINSQCDRLTDLINDLLDASYIEAGRALDLSAEEVNLDQLLQRTVSSQEELTDRHSFTMDLSPDAATVRGDPHRLYQVFSNLLSNAVKYSPDGGEVRLVARGGPETVCLEVCDQGMGIAPEYHDRIFDRFFQVDGTTTRRVGGSGSGLYLVKYLVEAHGGTVSVNSALGKGSTFTVELPRAATGPAR